MDGVVRVQGNGATPGENAGGDNARTRKRDSLFLSARLQVGGDGITHDVRVRNLSAGGLMAELDRTVPPGTAVALEMRGLGAMTGAVAWCAHGRMGIALDHPIDPARARKPVRSGTPTATFTTPLAVRAGRS